MPNDSRYSSWLVYIPYLGSAIIILGILKATVFYAFFGIDIISFLELSECLFLFVSDLAILAIAVLIAYLMLWGYLKKYTVPDFDSKLKEAEQLIENKETKTEEIIAEVKNILLELNSKVKTAELKKKRIISRIDRFFLFTYFFLGALVILMFIFMEAEAAIWTAILFSIYILYFSFQGKIIGYLDKTLSNKLPSSVIKNITILLLYIFLLLGYSFSKAIRIRYFKSARVSCEIVLADNKRISTSDSLIYLGSTKNWYFFYNSQTNEKTIYPTNQITSIKYK